MKKIFATAVVAVVAVAASACTPSAEVIERAAVDRISTALDLGDLQCEDVRPHPRDENVWIVYCDLAPTSNPDVEWALVDSAVKYDGPVAVATANAIYQVGDAVRSLKQTCLWTREQDRWISQSCTSPVLVATFPLA